MLKSYLFVGAVICSFITFSQKKQLTLDQAVLQQHRALGAETLPSFQWIPTTDSYTYLNSYTKLMKASVSNTKAVEIISIEEVNKVLNAKLNWFSGFEWKDKTTFYVNDGFKFYSFNITSKTGKLLYDLGETAENPTVQTTKENIAYTIENNLFVYQPDGKKIAITENADKNIVSGQTYARSEFGINNGIFW